jgi:urease accessory protein
MPCLNPIPAPTASVMVPMLTDAALLRLLQLSSAALPVGGYSFSQGLEYAVECGWVIDFKTTEEWLALGLSEGLGSLDIPIASRLYCALDEQDSTAFHYWNRYALAARESRELLLADVAMGDALLRLLSNLPQALSETCNKLEPSFLAVFVSTAWQWQISEKACVIGLVWCWLEAQIAAATKLVPLGQTQAQQLLGLLQQQIPAVLDRAATLQDDDIGNTLPGLAMASALHETQYCRLFRS